MAQARTLFGKIWDAHVVRTEADGTVILYVDRHLVHEVATFMPFNNLREAKRGVRRPDATLGTMDHVVPTAPKVAGDRPVDDPSCSVFVDAMNRNMPEAGITLYGLDDERQGIEHIVGPEQGFVLPGITLLCPDSHTATNGALGCIAFGIGTSEVEHVLATQTLRTAPMKTMRVTIDGTLPPGATAKDMALAVMRKVGAQGGTGYSIEYAGNVVRNLSMEGRLTLCNMTIEAGATAGMVAPDEITFAYLKGRPHAPQGADWDEAVAFWKTLPSDPGARFDKEVHIDAATIAPLVTWGTSPEDVVAIDGTVPDLSIYPDPDVRRTKARSLDYMGLTPGTKMTDVPIDRVFIGSCANSRIEDLRAAADVLRGRRLAEGVIGWVVPGSGLVRKQAEAEGLDRIFKEAGFDWREPGCSMCVGLNGDMANPGERVASTSNRNFEGRQGPRVRTHLMSPAMAAAAGVNGRLTDVRELLG